MEFIIERASSFAEDIDHLILLIAILGGAWLFLAEFILFYFCYKFSRKRHPHADYITGEKHHEAKWIHWPHYAVIACDIVIIACTMPVWYKIKQTLPTAKDTVRIVAQQWAWTFVHPKTGTELGSDTDLVLVDELHLKVDNVYHFKLESKDVLHSFSVPVFRLKQDAIPGRVITGWFTPTKVGQYDIQCAEMCGIGHGIMGAKLFVHTAEDYDTWFGSTKGANTIVHAGPVLEEPKKVEAEHHL